MSVCLSPPRRASLQAGRCFFVSIRFRVKPATERALVLLVPGLFGPARTPAPAAAPPPVPTLETWLGRAEPARALPPGVEAGVFALFDIVAPTDADLPVAAVTRVLDLGVIDKGWWLRADPVHLQPERDRLILSDNHALRLEPHEAESLVAEIMETYGADGWLFKAARPGRWYLKPPRAPRMITTPLPQVIGRDIHPSLPQGKDGKAWHTILNEIQILLHTAKVNAEREARGALAVNSLWFWGGGRLPNLQSVNWAHVWSHEPVSLALARLSQTPSSGVPENFADWARQARTPGAHLIVLDHARAAVQYREENVWREFMQTLERDWIAPLWAALKGGDIEQITLHDDTGRGFLLTARHARRWWRRRVRLGD